MDSKPLLLPLLLLSPGVVGDGVITDVTYVQGNIYYEFDELTYFEELSHAVREYPTWIQFNDITFYVSAATKQTIEPFLVNEELLNINQGERVVWFWGTITDAVFNLTGFPGYNYKVTVDDELLIDCITNNSKISFNATENGHYQIYHTTPDYDVIMDGDVDLLDLVAVAIHYKETGTNGWIREDVDNEGEVNVLDLLLVGNYY